MEGLHRRAGINLLLHFLARAAPRGGEDENRGLAVCLGRLGHNIVGGGEFRAAFGEISRVERDCKSSGENEEGFFHGLGRLNAAWAGLRRAAP